MIRLQSLSINNFRGIETGQIDGLADVNVLVGRNNSGKTTVIEAITMAAIAGGRQQDLFGRTAAQFWQNVRAAVPTGGFQNQAVDPHSSLLFYRQDKSKEIRIAGVLESDTEPPEMDRIVFHLKAGVHGPIAMGQQPRGTGLQPEQKQAFCAGINVFRPADAFNSTVEQKFWPVLLSDRRDRQLTETLNEVFGLDAESFQLLPNSQFTVLFHDYSLPLDVQGDGTRAALRTLMTLSMLKDTLLMIEEPECHQHPGSLQRFAAALCRLAKSRSVQVMVSTHSAECVRSFMLAAEKAESSAAVFHLSLDRGKQDARRLDPEAVETLTSTGVDVRFIDLYA